MQSDLVYSKQMVVMLLIVVDMVNTQSWAVVPDILKHCTVAVAPMANSCLMVEHHTHAEGFQLECTHLYKKIITIRL